MIFTSTEQVLESSKQMSQLLVERGRSIIERMKKTDEESENE